MKKLADNGNTLQTKIRSLRMKKLVSKTARMRTGTLWITQCGLGADVDTNLYIRAGTYSNSHFSLTKLFIQPSE